MLLLQFIISKYMATCIGRRSKFLNCLPFYTYFQHFLPLPDAFSCPLLSLLVLWWMDVQEAIRKHGWTYRCFKMFTEEKKDTHTHTRTDRRHIQLLY